MKDVEIPYLCIMVRWFIVVVNWFIQVVLGWGRKFIRALSAIVNVISGWGFGVTTLLKFNKPSYENGVFSRTK
jgi:predicted P-loop ATPase/GTPase